MLIASFPGTYRLLKYDPHIAPGLRPIRWGSEDEASDYTPGTTYEWFKLALQKGAHAEELAKKYPSKATEICQSDCEKLIVDYLTAMRRNFDELMRAKSFGHLPREFIITVPAIWEDKAKHLTRVHAAEAGMGNSSGIQIIKEPEAAGVYAFAEMQDQLGIQTGDTFVLCDAGGG